LFRSEAALGTRWSSIDLSRQLIAVARDRSIRLRTVLLPGIREGVDHPLVKLPDSIDCRTTDLDDPVAVEEKASMIASGIRGERDDVEVLGVPFMVAAMTREQAHGLETGEALAGASVSPLEQQAAGMLLDELTRHDVEQLSSS